MYRQSAENSSANFLMPFGKYSGEPVRSLPLQYLVWLSENADLYGRLAEEVEAAINHTLTFREFISDLLQQQQITPDQASAALYCYDAYQERTGGVV